MSEGIPVEGSHRIISTDKSHCRGKNKTAAKKETLSFSYFLKIYWEGIKPVSLYDYYLKEVDFENIDPNNKCSWITRHMINKTGLWLAVAETLSQVVRNYEDVEFDIDINEIKEAKDLDLRRREFEKIKKEEFKRRVDLAIKEITNEIDEDFGEFDPNKS